MVALSDGSVSNDPQSSSSETLFTVTFPQQHDLKPLQQDEEYAEVQIGKKRQKIRIHDYNTMYAQPGLYE